MAAKALLFVGCLALVACGQPNSTSPQSYCHTVANAEDLKVERSMGNVQYEARYLPNAFDVFQQLGSGTSQDRFEAALNEREGIQTLELRMQPAAGADAIAEQGLHSLEGWQDRDNYLSYNMARHLKLVQNEDTMSCLLAHRVASHDLAKFITYRVAFEGQEPTSGHDLQLIYTDPFFNHGPLSFRFSGASIHGLPTIQFSET